MRVRPGRASLPEAPEATQPAATDALLRFAGMPPGTPSEGPYDRADLSAAGLGTRTGGAPWWDAGRGGMRLVGANLSGASLARADLSRADLSGADLSGAKCPAIVLTGAALEGAVLRGADLVGGRMAQLDAGQAVFSEALLEDADFREAGLRFADFSEAVMDGADLSGADLWGARMGGVAAERASFRNTRLDEGKLAGGDFSHADFAEASLRRADLTGAKLAGALLRDAVLDGADLSGADLSGAVLPHVSLASCKLTGTRFAGAWLDRTRMRAHQLDGAIGEERDGAFEAAVDGYIVLEQNFRTLGRAEDASWAFRRRRRMGKRLSAQRARAALAADAPWSAVQSGLAWFTDTAAEWLCDYGESVPRVLRALVLTLLAFAALYWATGTLEARTGVSTAGLAQRHSAAMDYLLFSLDSMTTVGTSEVELRPAGQLGVLLSSVQTVIGTVLLGLFGFVLGVRMRN